MSISSEIQKLQTNLANSYEACNDKGATMPASQNFDNLPDCINSINNTSNYLISNVTKVGALVDNKGVLSSFAGSTTPKYAQSNIPSIGNNTWEFVVDFTTGNTLNQQEIIGISTRGASPFYMWTDGGLRCFLSNNGTSWDIYSPTTSYIILSTNTNYKFKCAFDGSKYTVSRYVNDEWVVLETVTSSTPINSNQKLWIGINQRGSTPGAPFLGSINLNECYLKVGGETVWTGMTTQN